MKRLIPFVALLLAPLAYAGYGYWPDGSVAWNGSYAYHDDGSVAWNGSYAYHDDGSVGWNGSYGYYDDGSVGWNGSTCYSDSGSVLGHDSCAWSLGRGASFSVIKVGSGTTCTVRVSSSVIPVSC